jgi:TctA family transporter
MLAIWGLAFLSVQTRGAVLKGLSVASLGLLLSFIGRDPRTAELRYTFGTLHLQDGLGTIPVFLGIFALAEVLHLVLSGRPTISGKLSVDEMSGSVWDGVMSVFRHFGIFIRSSIIGTVVGIIPGVGATVASFVAYGQAAQAREGRDRFGQGDIRGVLAPEAANDAKDGGSLVPTLAFGIPGGAGTTVLLAALTVHGLAPGREMLSTHLSLTFALIWSLFLSNWLTSILGLATVNPIARLTTVRTQLLVPFILLLATMGAYLHRGRIEDVLAACCFGILGYFMKKHGWPRIPFVIGFILGPLFENNLHITLRLHQLNRINFWERPIVLALLFLTLATLLLPYLQAWKRGSKKVHRS